MCSGYIATSRFQIASQLVIGGKKNTFKFKFKFKRHSSQEAKEKGKVTLPEHLLLCTPRDLYLWRTKESNNNKKKQKKHQQPTVLLETSAA